MCRSHHNFYSAMKFYISHTSILVCLISANIGHFSIHKFEEEIAEKIKSSITF